MKLKRIALGYGIQNYTCSIDKDGKLGPAATGALAGLYDITNLYPGQGPKSLDQATFDSLTRKVVETADLNIPLNLEDILENRVPDATAGASLSKPFKAKASLPVPGTKLKLPYIGQHYFDSAGVPTFKLDGGLSIAAKKLDAYDAPKASAGGKNGEKAVAWLRLGPKEGTEGSSTKGVKMVYRVSTGAGSAHSCPEEGPSDSSFYTAAYWFYG